MVFNFRKRDTNTKFISYFDSYDGTNYIIGIERYFDSMITSTNYLNSVP